MEILVRSLWHNIILVLEHGTVGGFSIYGITARTHMPIVLALCVDLFKALRLGPNDSYILVYGQMSFHYFWFWFGSTKYGQI